MRPVGLAKTHLGSSKLELYRYKYNPHSQPEQKSIKHRPSVYYDFLWPRHEKYGGFISIQLSYLDRPKFRYLKQDEEAPGNLFEEERAAKDYL